MGAARVSRQLPRQDLAPAARCGAQVDNAGHATKKIKLLVELDATEQTGHWVNSEGSGWICAKGTR